MNQINPTMNNQQKEYVVVFTCPEKDKIYNIEVQPDTTFRELGDELHSALQCQPDEKCVLWFQNIELSNDKTLNDYQIGKGRQIEIKIVKVPKSTIVLQPQEIELNIQVPKRSTNYNLKSIMNNTTVQELADKVQTILQLPADKKVIFHFYGQRLINVQQTLAQLSIINSSTLVANIESIGGFLKST